MSSNTTPTREQMLKAVISKSVKNGFTPYWKNNSSMVSNKEGFMDTIIQSVLRDYSQKELLFDHSFAKAFWGEERGFKVVMEIWKNVPKNYDGYAWEYHLQQAVISDDPLLYYYNNL